MNVGQSTFPSTRYSGSKRRSLAWIWARIKDIRFESAADVFGGTGSVSLLLKAHRKLVHYNDLLGFNSVIGTAIIENRETKVSDREVDRVLVFDRKGYPSFIRDNFSRIFYRDAENEWLDRVVYNIQHVSDKYKRSILMAALFQACLAKRPFNLFHRANLQIRTRRVKRTFGNKTTWERPFDELLRRYVAEYNRSVFDNGKKNKVIGGYDAFLCPNGVDLVYLDPPYCSTSSTQGTNYLLFYHFLEGLANYDNWAMMINSATGKTKRPDDTKEIDYWAKKKHVSESFKKLIERFQNNIIVLSYQSDGIPSRYRIMEILRTYKKRVAVYWRPTRYVLSKSLTRELLFIAR